MASENNGSQAAATLTYYLALAGTGLYIRDGKQWKDSGQEPVSFSRAGAATVRYTGVEMSLSLYGVSFSRKLCEPGHVQAEILITTEGSLTVDRLAEMLVRRPVSVSVKYSETGSTYTIAKDYYIHDIASQFQVRNNMNYIYVKLNVFSPDKMLTLNKFSQAYLGRALFSDLTKETLADFVLKYQAILSNGTSKATPLESRMAVDVGVLHHLGYQVIGRTKVGKEVPTQKEMLHPYLVQYNESFHDFLSRVSNRCGEVFYYENGRLNLGVHKQKEGPKAVSGAKRIIFQRVTSAPFTVPEYTRDSVKEWNTKANTFSPGAGMVYSDPVARNAKGFPSEAFPASADGIYKKYYNCEIAAEDHYMLLYKDKFARDSFMDYWWGNTDKQLMSTLNDALNSTSLLELVSSADRKFSESSRKSASRASQAKKDGNGKLNDAALDGEDKYAVLFTKVNNSTSRWLTLNYYTDIKKNELAQMRKMVCVDMADKFMNVRLGDRITLPGQGENEYLVVQIDMTAPEKWQCNYDLSEQAPKDSVQSQRFYAIPLIKKVTKTVWTKDFQPQINLTGEESPDGAPQESLPPESYLPEGLQEGTTTETENTDSGTRTTVTTVTGTKVTVVTTTVTWVLFPPMMPVPPFRQSGAQSAFVIDSGDPVSQGRVRVRYPWQPSIKDLDDKVDKCQKDCDSHDRTLKEARKNLEQYADIVGEDKITKKSTALQWDFDDAKKAYDDARTEKKKAAAKLKAAKDTRTKYEAATPWIRMATPMATPGGGMYFKPEIGDEVMVDFENGNIERPFVVGTLYSKNLTVPPGSRSIVSKNGHTIRMFDPTDSSSLSKGLYPGLRLLSQYGIKVPNLEGKVSSMLGGIELTDKFGFYDIRMSSHERNISISSPFGDIRIGALTGISIDAPNGDINISGKNVNISAWNNMSFNSGRNVRSGLEATGRWGGFLPSGSGRSKYMDLSLLRSLLEAVIRPVEGTLEIKSGRYLLLESGGGTAMPEWSKYNTKWESWFAGEMKTKWEALILEELIRYAVGKVPKLHECLTAYNDAVQAFYAARLYLAEGRKADSPAPVKKPASGKELLQDMVALDYKSTGVDDVYDACKHYFTGIELAPSCTPWVAEQCFQRILELGNALAFWKRFVSHDMFGFNHIYDEIPQGAIQVKGFQDNKIDELVPKDFLKKANELLKQDDDSMVKSFTVVLKKVIEAVQDKKIDDKLFSDFLEDSAFSNWETGMKRRVARMIIEKCRSKDDNPFLSLQVAPSGYAPIQQTNLVKDSSIGTTVASTAPSSPESPYSDNDWKLYVNDIRLMDKAEEKQDKSSSNMSGGAAKEPAGKVSEADIWKSDSKAKGDILFANKGDKTYRFTEFGQTEMYKNPIMKEQFFSSDSESLRNLLTGI